jgi:hypothetical protein
LYWIIPGINIFWNCLRRNHHHGCYHIHHLMDDGHLQDVLRVDELLILRLRGHQVVDMVATVVVVTAEAIPEDINPRNNPIQKMPLFL